MDTTNTANDLATELAGILQSRDATRLAQLKQAASLAGAQRSAMETEQKRLMGKYGAGSPQAAAAAQRLALLDQDTTALAGSIARASTPVPAIEAGKCVIYGRLLDAQGKGVSGAKLTATDANGSAIASGASKAQGIFEISVPLQSSRKSTVKAAEEAAPASVVTVQVVITSKDLAQPSTFPETITCIAGRIAYREITLPDNS
jgi:hypothetical protein